MRGLSFISIYVHLIDVGDEEETEGEYAPSELETREPQRGSYAGDDNLRGLP